MSSKGLALPNIRNKALLLHRIANTPIVYNISFSPSYGPSALIEPPEFEHMTTHDYGFDAS